MIGAWVDGGAPMGNPADMSPMRQFPAAGTWVFGAPDLIVSSPTQTVKAVGADWHGPLEGVAVPTGLTEDRWVKAVEVREFRPEEKTTVATANRADGATPSYFTVHHSAVEVQRADGGNSETVGEGAAPRSSGGLPRAELSSNSR